MAEMDILSEYTAIAAERYLRREEQEAALRSTVNKDVYIRTVLSAGLEAQWKLYVQRATSIVRPAQLYQYSRKTVICRKLGDAEDAAEGALNEYVRGIARPRFMSYKTNGYRAIVKPCRTKYGIKGLGDVSVMLCTETLVMDTRSEFLEFYRKAQATRWSRTKSLALYPVKAESQPDLTKDFAVFVKSNFYEIYVDVAAEKYQKRVPLEMGGKAKIVRCALGDVSDDFKHVKALYAGKPDEIYRRKSSKKFAIYRRLKLAQESHERQLHHRAEINMLRQREREGDRIRAERDTLNPFLFCNGKNTFAYCSKLSEAGRHKEILVKKYLAVPTVTAVPDAVDVLTSKPSFNLRVMNRFG
eukprot:Plantae.Rhodophyta-Purpureofilum_apyrenoidigerum.ctg809.p1 GENE.Plantae.Rhodophyta-Purpureofilum_apyrenoidigerum.ctg809~~Plantae.Rhodophyta-Purpureofilum_apyrenoidigerum.ctg809.p1  ORF type:complete len:364 (-),score=58.21 Plantae.Rhodophyta-Purpureofilum_apyrenoidigerum.ctg809:374-1444(-)